MQKDNWFNNTLLNLKKSDKQTQQGSIIKMVKVFWANLQNGHSLSQTNTSYIY